MDISSQNSFLLRFPYVLYAIIELIIVFTIFDLNHCWLEPVTELKTENFNANTVRVTGFDDGFENAALWNFKI